MQHFVIPACAGMTKNCVHTLALKGEGGKDEMFKGRGISGTPKQAVRHIRSVRNLAKPGGKPLAKTSDTGRFSTAPGSCGATFQGSVASIRSKRVAAFGFFWTGRTVLVIKMGLATLCFVLIGSALSGCAVVSVVDAAVTVVSTAVSIGATVVGTTVDVAAAGVRAVLPSNSDGQ
jgi:hypothetical protein